MNASLGFWLEITGSWGASRADRAAVYRNLITAYCSKNRHYHDLTHIEHMLDLANEVRDQVKDHAAMYLAIWFHDSIQKLGRDSEQLSTNFAKRQLLKLNAPDVLIDNVASLILATKHQPTSSGHGDLSTDEKIISDIDLSILGGSGDEYQQYVKECRKEYPVSDFLYKRGRSNFLKGMLETGHIFLTDYFKERFESLAFTNIQLEMEELK